MNLILNNPEDEIAEEFSGEFGIHLTELVNTIITSDILKILKAICSNREYNKLLDCKIQTAAFYRKSDQRSKDEFINILQNTNPKLCYMYDTETQSVADKRPKIWTAIPLKGLVEPLLTLRKEKKALVKQEIKTRN